MIDSIKKHAAVIMAALALFGSAGVAVGERGTIGRLNNTVASLCSVQNNGLRAKDDQIAIYKSIAQLLALNKASVQKPASTYLANLTGAAVDYVAFESQQPSPSTRKGC